MKNLILLSIVLLLSVCTLAQDTKKGCLPTDTLIIDEFFNERGDIIRGASMYIANKKKTKGTTFKAGQKITDWSNVTSVRVRNKRTREFVSYENPANNKSGHSNFFTGLINCIYRISYIGKHLRTKGDAFEENVVIMKEELAQTFYMIDGYFIYPSSLSIDSNHYYLLEPDDYSGAKPLELKTGNKEIIISKSTLIKNNISIEEKPCTFKVSYVVKDNGEWYTIKITNRFRIEDYINRDN